MQPHTAAQQYQRLRLCPWDPPPARPGAGPSPGPGQADPPRPLFSTCEYCIPLRPHADFVTDFTILYKTCLIMLEMAVL